MTIFDAVPYMFSREDGGSSRWTLFPPPIPRMPCSGFLLVHTDT